MPDLAWNDRWNTEAERYLKGEGPATGKKKYGYHWGDPEDNAYSGAVLKREFIDPFIGRELDIAEVGCGGGRFTQYLVSARSIALIEYNEKMFDIIRSEFLPEHIAKMRFIKSGGSDLNGLADGSLDRVFTFDVFVHLEMDLIEGYIKEMARVLRSGGIAIIHYADNNKELAKKTAASGMFVVMYPEDMRALAAKYDFTIVKEDTKSISHSSVIAMKRN